MGWLVILGFAVLAGLALWRWGRLTRQGFELAGTALLLGVAGYAWQGSPSQAGSPVKPAEAAVTALPDAKARQAMMGQFGTDAQWLSYADTLNGMGMSRLAVTAIKSGLKEHPNSADLWVGLGNALVAHGGGLMNPAAEVAFQRAASLSPEHPGPPFFYGLALAQSGKPDEAGEVWRGLLARAPDDAPWKEDLEQRLAAIGQMPVKAGEGGPGRAASSPSATATSPQPNP